MRPTNTFLGVSEVSKHVTVYWNVWNKKTKKEVSSTVRGSYKYVWCSTAAYVKTIFLDTRHRLSESNWRKGVSMKFLAALNLLDGQVIGQCQQHHTHVEWLKFLKKIDRLSAIATLEPLEDRRIGSSA